MVTPEYIDSLMRFEKTGRESHKRLGAALALQVGSVNGSGEIRAKNRNGMKTNHDRISDIARNMVCSIPYLVVFVHINHKLWAALTERRRAITLWLTQV